MVFFKRLGKWLQAVGSDAISRRYAVQSFFGASFRLGLSKFGSVYLTYHPDSYFVFKAHPEFDDLFIRFTKNNRSNNAGDIVRLWAFILNIKQVISEKIPGDFAELGVWRGNSAAILAQIAAASDRNVLLFDTYEGFDARDLRGIDTAKDVDFSGTSIELVQRTIGPEYQNCDYVKGYFPDSITSDHKNRSYAIVSLDCDLYEPMRAGLEFFYPRMPKGGLFMLHDYSSLSWDGAKRAIDEFCKATGEFVVLLPDKSGSAFFRKMNLSPHREFNS